MARPDEPPPRAKLLGARLTDRLAGHGQSMPRFHLLVELTRRGPLRLTRLGQQVGVSQGTASTLAEALVREGLVERADDPDDGRATRLAVTETGRKRAQAWLTDFETATEEVFGGVPDGERAVLFDILRRLSASLMDER
jgi:DNA-binding MarR family transcriptional regulator